MLFAYDLAAKSPFSGHGVPTTHLSAHAPPVRCFGRNRPGDRPHHSATKTNLRLSVARAPKEQVLGDDRCVGGHKRSCHSLGFELILESQGTSHRRSSSGRRSNSTWRRSAASQAISASAGRGPRGTTGSWARRALSLCLAYGKPAKRRWKTKLQIALGHGIMKSMQLKVNGGI